MISNFCYFITLLLTSIQINIYISILTDSYLLVLIYLSSLYLGSIYLSSLYLGSFFFMTSPFLFASLRSSRNWNFSEKLFWLYSHMNFLSQLWMLGTHSLDYIFLCTVRFLALLLIWTVTLRKLFNFLCVSVLACAKWTR